MNKFKKRLLVSVMLVFTACVLFLGTFWSMMYLACTYGKVYCWLEVCAHATIGVSVFLSIGLIIAAGINIDPETHQ